MELYSGRTGRRLDSAGRVRCSGRGRRRFGGIGRLGARLVRGGAARRPSGALRVQGHPLQPRRAATAQEQHALTRAPVLGLHGRRPPPGDAERADPALVGAGQRHERGPALRLGAVGGDLPPLRDQLTYAAGRRFADRRNRERALRPLPLRPSVRPRPAAVARRPARAAAPGGSPGRGREGAGGSVLPGLPRRARTPVRRAAPAQPAVRRKPRPPPAHGAKDHGSLHLRLLLRGHGRAAVVRAGPDQGPACPTQQRGAVRS